MNGGRPDPIRRIVVGVDGSDDAMRAVASSARLARGTGAEYRAELIAGGPKALIEFAISEEADVIGVGRRGRGGFAELVLGSFSHHLVHHSHTPVIVVPSAQD
jgi:nucleotide-binding universal stress UspA family protein